MLVGTKADTLSPEGLANNTEALRAFAADYPRIRSTFVTSTEKPTLTKQLGTTDAQDTSLCSDHAAEPFMEILQSTEELLEKTPAQHFDGKHITKAQLRTSLDKYASDYAPPSGMMQRGLGFFNKAMRGGGED
jgi:hypothetical protein